MENLERCIGAGIAGVDNPNCFVGAVDSVARLDVSDENYQAYEQVLIAYDSMNSDEYNIQIEKLLKRLASDLGCSTKEWEFSRVVSEGGLERKLSTYHRLGMLTVIDISHREMYYAEGEEDDGRFHNGIYQSDDETLEATHALGVSRLTKGLYILSGSWVPEDLKGPLSASSIFPHLAQSKTSPYRPRIMNQSRYDTTNITALPLRTNRLRKR